MLNVFETEHNECDILNIEVLAHDVMAQEQ